jgi:hypothetical protein
MLGTPVLAAYAIGRRVMLLVLMPGWGYSTAASTLVGQAIGAGDDAAAMNYGWQTLWIGLATQLLLAVVLVAGARPIATFFGTEHVALSVDFIRAFGVGTAGFSVSRTMRGSLRGAGDTRWRCRPGQPSLSPACPSRRGSGSVRRPFSFRSSGTSTRRRPSTPAASTRAGGRQSPARLGWAPARRRARTDTVGYNYVKVSGNDLQQSV